MRFPVASVALAARPRCAPPRLRLAPSVSIAVVAALLSACASNGNQYQSSGVTRHAAVQPPLPKPKPEVEDDGQPVQAPPARIMRPDEDDPTQPWSPNYGQARATPARTASDEPLPTRAPHRAQASAIVPDVYAASARPMTEDEIIARAVAQHEMAAQQRR